eukprot:m.182473 g.182473  ORF g.182473 m.182473 type:complete len:344 (-) comp18064_c0_seq2:1120-2151(-)
MDHGHQFDTVMLVALLVFVVLSACADSKELYRLPEASNLSSVIVLANPHAGQQPQGHTLVVFWRLGTQAQLTPATWLVGNWTGVYPPPSTYTAPTQLGISPIHSPNTVNATSSDVNAAVHNTASTVQWHGFSYGCFLDTEDNRPPNGTRLGTIVVSYDWLSGELPRPFVSQPVPLHDPGVRVSFYFQAKRATKPHEGAVYSTLSLGFKHFDPVSGKATRFVWYETSIFDYQRGFKESIMVDSISGNPIVHGVLLGANTSRYHAQAPGSANSANETFSSWRFYEFEVRSSHVKAAFDDVNTRFPSFALPMNLSDWALAHYNLENEGLARAHLGLRVANLTITEI